MNTSNRPVAVLGCGKMGETLAAGMVRAGVRAPDQILVSDIDDGILRRVVAEHGFRAAGSREAAEAAGPIIVAVKPKDVAGLIAQIAPALSDEHLVVSIAAGITIASIERGLSNADSAPVVAVVRAMPNIAALVGRGITAISAGSRAGDEHMAVARELFEGVGPVVAIQENYLDAVTAVSGSGPAYFALVAEAMVDAGVTAGLPRSVASLLVAHTMLGTATLVTEAGMAPAAVREAVMSPAGTTAMAVRELERAGVRAAFADAVQAALDRSRELSAPGEE